MWYWGSFTQQRGFELSLGDGYLEATYCLTLRKYRDGLVRRPAADWNTSKFHSELSNVTCHLYGLEELDGKENNADDQAEVDLTCVLEFVVFQSSGDFYLDVLNPLRPNNDPSQTSHCNIKGVSVSEVMRIKNMITQVKFY